MVVGLSDLSEQPVIPIVGRVKSIATMTRKDVLWSFISNVSHVEFQYAQRQYAHRAENSFPLSIAVII